jgi:hypothetical protein
MTTYRKRGTEVEAIWWQTDDAAFTRRPAWIDELIAIGRARLRGTPGFLQLFLDPPSGKGNPLVCNRGDWIVRNARGEVFPMTAEKFGETYEATADASVDDASPCSFCGKNPREVRHLAAASTGARICDECLIRLDRLLAETIPEAPK